MTELLQKLLDAVKGLTLLNIAVLALLLFLLLPAYLAWKIMNDEMMFNAVFSAYSELDSPTDCSLTFQQAAGGRPYYLIRQVMAVRSRETYGASVRLDWDHLPDHDAMVRYCDTLDSIVAYARDPNNSVIPRFPQSNRPLLPYAPPKGEKDDGKPVAPAPTREEGLQQ